MRKFTGVLPSWAASDEQKQALEKMMGQVQEQDMPGEDELKKMHEEGGAAVADEGWMSGAKSMMSSVGGGEGGEKSAGTGGQKEVKGEPSAESTTHEIQDDGGRKKPRKLETKPKDNEGAKQEPAGDRKKPKKLETRSSDTTDSSQNQDSGSATVRSAEQRESILKKMLQERGVTEEEIESRLNVD